MCIGNMGMCTGTHTPASTHSSLTFFVEGAKDRYR